MTLAYVLIGLMLIQLVLFSLASGYQLQIWSKKFHPSFFHKRDICSGIGFILMYIEAQTLQLFTPQTLGSLWIAAALFGVLGLILLNFGLKQRRALYGSRKK